MNPAERCPRFSGCNAAICPLAADWRRAVHRPGERVCYYALASCKGGAADRFAGDPTYAAVLAELPAVRARHPAVAKAVDRAARSGFRGLAPGSRGNLRKRPSGDELGGADSRAPGSGWS
jgi:hypothetical protein